MVKIYSLIDPITREIRYIGQTKNLKQRIGNHLGKGHNLREIHWVKRLKKKGLKPLFVVLEEVPNEMAYYIEKLWISFYSSKCNLLNYAQTKNRLTLAEQLLIKKYTENLVNAKVL